MLICVIAIRLCYKICDECLCIENAYDNETIMNAYALRKFSVQVSYIVT